MKGLSTTIRTLLIYSVILFSTQKIQAQTDLSGNISSDLTLTKAGNPYLVNTITVLEGVTLTINEGTVLKFKGAWENINVYGTLNVNGTAQEPVIFTSIKDDSDGNDSNADGNATTPQPGDWACIWFQQGSYGNTINNAILKYGGGANTSAMVNSYTTSVEIENSNFENSAERGIWLSDCSPEIHDCNFIGNQTDGVYISGLDSTQHFNFYNNTFTDNVNWAVICDLKEDRVFITLSENSSTGSAHNGFGIFGKVVRNVSFDGNDNFPFIVYGNVQVTETGMLDFTEGTVVKFNSSWDYIDVYGRLTGIGSTENPVVFTSLKDDAYGGDTNGDGSASQAEKGDWAGIWIRAGSKINQFDYARFRYGGGSNTSAILNIYTDDIQLNSCSFDYSIERGIYAENCSPEILGCSFTGNQTDGVYISGLSQEKDLNFSNNTFNDNLNWAALCVLSDNKADITLSGNNSSGSAHNGFGLSGNISGDVTFDANFDFPFIVNGSVVVNESGALRFNDNTVVKFNSSWDNIDVYGKLTSNGSLDEPVVFTSLKDDQYGGDTNSDMDASVAQYGDWSAIWLRESSKGNIFTSTYFRYGGGSNSSAIINIYTDSTSFNRCYFEYSIERGVYSSSCSPDFTNCFFTGNQTDGIYLAGLSSDKDLDFYHNIFTDNLNWAALCDLGINTVDILLNRNSSTGSAHNGFGISNHVADEVVFEGETNFPFIINGNTTVDASASLKFTQGSVIKFNSSWDNIDVYGSLVSEGTSIKPVVFTALADDMYGGDTNGDADASVANKGEWSGIWLRQESKANQFDYTYFRYGGGSNSSATLNIYTDQAEFNSCEVDYSIERGIYISDASPDITNCSFTGNQTDGIYITGLSASKDFVFNQNTFTDNINWAVNSDIKNCNVDISLVGNSSTGSSRNGFGIGGYINENVEFNGQNNFPYIVIGSVEVKAQKKLTVSPGTGFKFNSTWDNINVFGTLHASGTDSNPIYFTSVLDDNLGGDTNGDQNATSASPGEWSALWLQAGSSANVLKNVKIKYSGGANSSAAVNIYSSGVSIDSSEISYSIERGFYISGANPAISRTIIANNTTDGIYTTTGALPDLSSNRIMNNTNYGIYNADGSVDVDARNTWWGSASGPYHPTLNASGQGNQVSDHVLFDPWKITTSANNLSRIDGIVLGQHYPNPATGNITIPFSLDKEGRVVIEVVNTDGKVVKSVLDENRQSGRQNVSFNSSALANGSYFIRLVSSGISCVNRLIVVN